MRKIEIFCTLGPNSLNKKFLKFAQKNVDLLRINMSHVEANQIFKIVKKIRSYTKTPICLDTEGAQIRTKVKKIKKFKKGETLLIKFNDKNYNFYPIGVSRKFKKNDILEIGFEGLIAKVTKKSSSFLKLEFTSSGKFENNKGVHLKNRDIKLNFLTKKDYKAIEISKNLKINAFALSFTNNEKDVEKFKKLLPKSSRKIFKIESKQAIKNLDKIRKVGSDFLIDRGDMSRYLGVEKIPLLQRLILKKFKDRKYKVAIATNFLESMIYHPFPNRSEANDIYSSLEQGASGLVLAAETAIGKYPIDAVIYLKKIINIFKKNII